MISYRSVKPNLITFLSLNLMSKLIKTILSCKFLTYADQLGGCSDDQFEKIDFFPCTSTILKLVSSERAFLADHNELYGFSEKLPKSCLISNLVFSKFLKKLFLFVFCH